MERIITYGASIWGGDLTKAAKQKLYSIQRMFLLQISRGYRTISTDALTVLTGIPPIQFTLQYEYLKSNILHLRNEEIIQKYFPNSVIYSNSGSWAIHPADETSHLQVIPIKNSFKPNNNINIYSQSKKFAYSSYAMHKSTVKPFVFLENYII